MIDGEQRRIGSRVYVNGSRTRWRVGMSPGSIELAIAKHDAFERRRFQGPIFERDDAAHRDPPVPLCLDFERIALRMGLGPRRVRPGYALRDQPSGTRGNRRFDEVSRPLVADASVANDRFPHLSRVEIFREIGELMDHDIRPALRNSARQGCSVEDIHHDWVRPESAQLIDFRRRSRGPDDVMAGVMQKRRQPPANDARRARKKDPVSHNYYGNAESAGIELGKAARNGGADRRNMTSESDPGITQRLADG